MCSLSLISNRMLLACFFVIIGLSDQSVASEDTMILEELQDRATNILSGKNHFEVDACDPFAEYGKYFHTKKKQGVSLTNAKLLIRAMAAKIPGSKSDLDARDDFLDAMEILADEIYDSSFINDENINYALDQYCKSTIQKLLLKNAEETRNYN